MASKLDELMALARECGNIERCHCIGKAQGFDVRDAYAALQSALKAVVEDAERYRWLKAEHGWTILGRKFPAIRPYVDADEVFYESLDAARKP